MTAGEVITNAQREIDRLQEENRQLRADLADERARAVALAEAHVELKADHEQAAAKRTELGQALGHLRADLADAKGAAASARADAERFRAERDALRVERCARDADGESACDLSARDLGRILLWAASVAIERDELRAEADQ